MIKDAKWAREVIKIRIENEQLQKEVNDRCDKLVEFICLQSPIDNIIACRVNSLDYKGIWDLVKSKMISRGFIFEIRNTSSYFVLFL